MGVVVRKDHPEALALAGKLSEWCERRGIKLFAGVEQERTVAVHGVEGIALSDLCVKCNVICSLGGDGTLISCARFSGEACPIFVGVHFGTLGFLTEITPRELLGALDRAVGLVDTPPTTVARELSTRSLFTVSIIRDGVPRHATQSLNDVVILKGAKSKLIDIDVHAGVQPVMRLRSDGLIIATPTGSTAYSMAAGGPIIEPSIAAMVLTPICPHSLTSRPLVLGTEAELSITLPFGSGPFAPGSRTSGRVFAIIDGVETIELEARDTVVVAEAPHRARFFRTQAASYFEALRRKLHWNAPNEGSTER
jgi:NAD+ kinase